MGYLNHVKAVRILRGIFKMPLNNRLKIEGKDRLVEVVNVECSSCGLITNNLTDWECCYNEIFGCWYYLCPNCSIE